MSSKKPEKRGKWAEPTPKQRLSHRSILRFVELADQLARDLRTILLPKHIVDKEGVDPLFVDFVSIDRHKDLPLPARVKDKRPVRFYNLRLLRTFRLTDDDEKDLIKHIWDWIKKNYIRFQPLFQCSDYLEGHSHDRFQAFKRCIEEARALDSRTMETESEEDKKQKRQIAERAHDLLVEAIAAMPYTELLPTALDVYFYPNNWIAKTTDPIRFKLHFKKMKVEFFNPPTDKSNSLVDLIVHSNKVIPDEAFRFSDQTAQGPNTLRKLYVEDFINWFTLGSQVLKKPNSEYIEESPYDLDGKKKDLGGFALPIYHFHDRAGNSTGGFEGWAIIRGAKYISALKRFPKMRPAVTLAVRAFSRRIREERMRELLEKEWHTTTDRRTFTLQQFGEFDGWIAEEHDPADLPTLLKDWQFGFLAKQKSKAGYNFKLYDKKPSLPPIPGTQDPSEITHIVVRPPADPKQPSAQEAMLLFRRRADTILPTTHDDLVDYGFHITQAVGQIYNAARLKENAMGAATQILAKDFAHQVQHIAGALSGGWIIREEDYQGVKKTVSKPPSNVRIAPLPELYQFADDVLALWSTQRATDLYGSDLYSQSGLPLSDILTVAASRAKAEWIAEESRRHALHLPGRIDTVQELIHRGQNLVDACNFSDVAHMSVRLEDTKESNELLIAYARVLEALIFNAFRHGQSAVVAKRNQDNPQAFWLENRSCKKSNSSNAGETVIQNLARQAGVVVSSGTWENELYSRLVTNVSIPWTHL